jgi:hypothetical protein
MPSVLEFDLPGFGRAFCLTEIQFGEFTAPGKCNDSFECDFIYQAWEV